MDNICAVEKAFDLLEYLTGCKEASLWQVSFALGLKPENVASLAQGLSKKGLVVQDEKRQVLCIGPKQFGHAQRPAGRELPKGVNLQTLRDVKKKLAQGPGSVECSAMEMALSLGVARSTARRYLEFLVGEGILFKRNQYVQNGRPLAKYCKNEAGGIEAY